MIWSGFFFGLLGSIHCVVMCGPLALAVPVKKSKRSISILFYNSGRILTYSLLGILFGLVGKGLYKLGFQSYLSITTGVFIILIVVYPVLEKILYKHLKFDYSKVIRNTISKLISLKSLVSVFLLGVFNGLLPCGLIYIAIAGAIDTGFVELAALYMFFFGLGTSILMTVTMYSKTFITNIKTIRLNKLVPYFTFALGILFILRGLVYMIPPEHQELAIVDILQKITMCNVR